MADVVPGAESPGKLKKILGLTFIIINVVGIGAGVYLTYISTLGVTEPSISEKEAEQQVKKFEESLRGSPVVYAMDPIATNLDGVPRHLVRVEVNLEMLDDEGFEEVINHAPQARDSITRILNNKSFSDVETVQGKLHLKNEIMGNLNAFLEKGIVKNVYFSEFVVQ